MEVSAATVVVGDAGPPAPPLIKVSGARLKHSPEGRTDGHTASSFPWRASEGTILRDMPPKPSDSGRASRPKTPDSAGSNGNAEPQHDPLFPEGGPEVLSEWKGYRLLDFQVRAIAALRRGENVLLSAPTGAGKTLVAEYSIADAVARGKRCIYTAPIKALSNQKFRDFRDDPEIDVGLMTGDVTIHPRAQVLIMTTEILRNGIFEDPDAYRDVESVIFDEIHFLDDPERGSVWEEALIFAPPSIRFLSLSATIANLDQLGAWMREIREQDLSVIHSDRRPVPLTHRLFRPEKGIFALDRLQWVQRSEGGGKKGRRRGGSRRNGGRRGRPRQDRHRMEEDQVGRRRLFDHLQEKDLLPALVFAFSRKDCERMALANQRRNLLSPEELELVEEEQRKLVELFQLDEGELSGEIFQLGRRGVGYHHAGVLPIHKEVVERMFTAGLIKMLFTTETFALGINMPARSVVFSSLRKFDGIAFEYMRTRDYLQMAGRAGRQGIDDRGNVVCYLDERALGEAPLQRMIEGRPEAVKSRFRLTYATILHLVEHLGRERLHEAWEKSFMAYQGRARSRKARERNARLERRKVEAQLALLEELGYVGEDDQLTPRGRTARLLYGFELQITELLFRGALENLPPKALATIFVGLVHESRRRTPAYVPPRLFGGVRRHVDGILNRLSGEELHFGIPTSLKLPDWTLTPAICGWFEGRDFEAMEELCEDPPGDVCRTFRMALQLVRQVRRTLDDRDSLSDRLDEVVEQVDRDEVDAKRQLELG